jgi:CIC family chloride channel protein
MPPSDESGGPIASASSRYSGRIRAVLRSTPLTIPENQNIRMNLIAIAIGVVAGLGAVGFRIAIWVVQELFYGTALDPGNVAFQLIAVPNLFSVLAPLGDLRLLVLPALGGLLVGVVIVLTTPEVRGHGVPNVLEAMLVRGGRINPKIAAYKAVASSIAIGSGGSLGREGPIIQIGSAAGSYFGQFVHSRHTRTLVAAGAAAGIAGTFNTPIAGIMFALEILLAEYYLQHVIAVVLSAVVATAVARPLLEFTATPGVRDFLVPTSYQLVTPAIEFPVYILLGIVIAVAGTLVVKLLYRLEGEFERLPGQPYVKPALGGFLLGGSVLLGAALFHTSSLQSATWLFGVGYNTVHSAISGELALAVLVGLAVLKAFGFSLSVGSGSSGGVFSPSLYIGAMVGGAFGVLVHAMFPATASAGAYALVGMGGVFAATASAPLTATIIIFELTGQYTIILPILVVSVIGSEVADALLQGGTIYTQKLRERGITVQERRIGSLEDLTADDVMTASVDTLPVGLTVGEAIERFQATDHHGMPVVDSADRVVAIVTLSDLQRVLNNHVEATLANGGSLDPVSDLEMPVEDIGTTSVLTAAMETNLLSVVDLMERADVGRIPIVDGRGRLHGIVTRSDVLDAYDNMPVELSEPLESWTVNRFD